MSGLSDEDAERFARTLDRLKQAGLEDAAVTGGVAIALHLARATGLPSDRPLHDLDIVVAGAGVLSPKLADAFLVSHAHLDARPGRMLLQIVDSLTALRIDIFGAYGDTLDRSQTFAFRSDPVRLVSPADLIARLATLLLDLGLGEPLPAKHARDFEALWAAYPSADVDATWRDHRRQWHPEGFTEACRVVRELVGRREHLLVDAPMLWGGQSCPPCRESPIFKLARDEEIVALLGYR